MRHERVPTYTWNDYCSWPEGQRWELVSGHAYAMAPSPSPRHQWVARELLRGLADFLGPRECEAFPAPLDVRLSETDVVQPDILVVCDGSQIRSTHIVGAPHLAVEVLSPSSLHHDRLVKLELYARYGVAEYWLVNPYPSLVEILRLDGETYRLSAVFDADSTLTSPGFPGLAMPLAEVFSFPLSSEERIAEIRECAVPYGAPA